MSKETYWGELTNEEKLEEIKKSNKKIISEIYKIKQCLKMDKDNEKK